MSENGIVKLVAGGVFALLGVIVFMTTYFTVDAYERAVVTRFGSIVEIADPGLHFKTPFVNSVQFFPIGIQNVQPKEAANTYTIDNQEVDVLFNVFYRVPADKIAYVYTNVPDYRVRLLTMAIDRLKAEMGKVNVAHVAERRGELRDRIKDVMARDALSLGVEITDFQLTNLEYTKSFKTAVEAAASAKAGIETQEQLKQQAQKNAETAQITAQGLANAQRAQAAGAADARLLQATAEAKAIQLQGEAQAAAIKAQAEALGLNARLVELRKAERWDGKLPTQMLSGITPLMSFDAAK